MSTINLYIILFSSLLRLALAEDLIFVFPSQLCNNDCTGDLTKPFNNILDALNSASLSASATVILLKDPSTPHYVLPYSNNNPSQTSRFVAANLTMRPLFCHESLTASDPSLPNKCINQGEKLMVYLKTVDFTIVVKKNLHVQSLIFDAIEDIETLNDDSPALESCITQRIRCCQPDILPSNIAGSGLRCGWTPSSLTNLRTTNNSLFELSYKDTSSSVAKSIIFEDVDFQNFQSPHLQSLIMVTDPSSSVTIMNSRIDSIYFNKGFITFSSVNTNGGSTLLTNSSRVVLQDVTFSNYNKWDITSNSTRKEEGYLFYADSTYSGVFQILQSTFTNISSAFRNSCWPQTDEFYNKPMNNLLTSQPGSRSDLWSYYHNNRGSNDYVSSLIYISRMDGTLAIRDCLFQHVIGTSGSVVRVDDIASSNTWFTIYNTTFDSNFAYDSFANLMIVKSSDPFLSSMLDCPHIEIVGSRFTNTRGCPGAYGNNLLLCYWDTQPQQLGFSSYSLATKSNEIFNVWTTGSEELAYIRVKESVFQNNMLSVSNSLAIIGASFTVMENNIFKDNGATTAELARISLSGSYFLQRYPSAHSLTSSDKHFGQSTAVYFDHFVKLISTNNTYQNNWGSWEGSLSLASSITLKNWIKVKNGVRFYNDYFGEHQGVPSSFHKLLTNYDLISSTYTEPVISLSLDTTTINQLLLQYTNANLVGTIPIVFQNLTFNNNFLQYNYEDYTYNQAELNFLLYSIFPFNTRYKTGLIKLLWTSESVDDISYGFKSDPTMLTLANIALINSKITRNQLNSVGCIFPNILLLENLHIESNEIFIQKDLSLDSFFIGESYKIGIDEKNQGLFCVGTTDFLGSYSRLQLTANSLLVKNNSGIMINIYPGTQARVYLTNSIFFNNTCEALGMITARTGSQLIQINNIFTGNNNFLGNDYLYMSTLFVGMFNLYLKNTGQHASGFYTEAVAAGYECMSKVMWNDINLPDDKRLLFDVLALSGVFYSSSSKITYFSSVFRENYPYSGLMTVSGGGVRLYYCQIMDHYIVGNSVLGTFYSLADLDIQNVAFLNNTIAKKNLLSVVLPGLIVMFTATLRMDNIQVVGGGAKIGGMLFNTNTVKGTMSNMIVRDFHREEQNQAALFHFTYSMINITNLMCSNITGVFEVVDTTLGLNKVSIEEVTNKYGSQFLLINSRSTLMMINILYKGNGEHNTIIPLIGGNPLIMIMLASQFTEATGGKNSIISLTSTIELWVKGCLFEYTESPSDVVVFDLTSVNLAIIENNIFSQAGAVVVASDILAAIFFTANIIITDSHMQNFLLQNSNMSSFIANQFIGVDADNSTLSSPESYLEISDPLELTFFKGNTFMSLQGSNGIIEVTAQEYPYQLVLQKNTFVGNTACQGGALHLSAQKQWSDQDVPLAQIADSVFVMNRANNNGQTRGKGGAIYQTSSQQTSQVTLIQHSFFVANTAETLGGAIFFDYSLPSITNDSVFIENYAVKLNHIGSYPIRLTQLPDTSLNPSYIPGTSFSLDSTNNNALLHWSNVASGVTTDKKYTLALVDMFGQIVYDDNSSTLDIYPFGYDKTNRSLFSDVVSVTAVTGIYTIGNFKFSYKAGGSIKLVFTSTAIPSFSPVPVPSLTITPSISTEVTFRACQLGEFTVVNSGYSTCQECPNGFWNLRPTSTTSTCTNCDTSSTICRGGNNVGPRRGYWRLNETADLILKCPATEACIGNSDAAANDASIALDTTGSCAEGYQGNLCSNCITGWAKGTSGECVDCTKNVMSYVLFILLLGLQFVFIAFGVKATMKEAEDFKDTENDEGNSAILIRIFLNYSQMFSILLAIPINWPQVLTQALAISSKVTALGDQLFSDCFFSSRNGLFGVRVVFLKALALLYESIYVHIIRRIVLGHLLQNSKTVHYPQSRFQE